MLRYLLKSLMGPEKLGMLDYYRFPHWRAGFRGPFNGQEFRKRIFLEILSLARPTEIIETGTYKGTTTEYLAQVSGLPVHSVELDPRHFGFARARFLWNRQVRCDCGDSRPFLRRKLGTPVHPDKPVFVYLDAHWNDDLPLKEEIEIIFSDRKNAVVMIDDFQVPNDKGYVHDWYEGGFGLTLEYLKRICPGHVQAFFPACPSDQETGHKAGCVVLAARDGLGPVLAGAKTLRPWDAL